MKHQDVKKGMRVTDRWWSWKLGKIIKKSRFSVWVRWNEYGIVERYDSAHVQFLEPIR